MKRAILSSIIVTMMISFSHAGEHVVCRVSWAEAGKAGHLKGGTPLSSEGKAQAGVLCVQNAESKPRRVTVLELPRPGVSALQYALRGQVRCQHVAEGSYLELWSHFPGGACFFTRTRAPHGPMRTLSGTGDWRPFVLPFSRTPDSQPPEKLVLNVVFQGPGTVELRGLELVEAAGAGAWWHESYAGWIGGIGGAFLGCMGALVGTLAGIGKARRLTLALAWLMATFGAIAVLVGLVAWSMDQPFAVYYPLVLGGGISAVVFGVGTAVLRRGCAQAELRKMAALDLGAPR